MRILVISDIHANLVAFKAVLEDAKGKWDKVWFLGDLVGYGPDPNECVALMQELDHMALSGNHDWAILGKLDISNFNIDARNAVLWAQGIITDETFAYLDALPPMLTEDNFTLAHASPRHPVWEYILDRGTAAINFAHFDTPYCLVGHTHVPIIYAEASSNHIELHPPIYSGQLILDDTRCIINPGSVGQPRDSDPRAAYALLDLEEMTWSHCRVPYDIAETQARMREHGLSDRLVARLAYGW
ncbi:MAG: metallophosphoesterase family protein [Anaerolineales bacterium]|nr:metallophosphoesterase family protein [Anaerolineales bacterium]